MMPGCLSKGKADAVLVRLTSLPSSIALRHVKGAKGSFEPNTNYTTRCTSYPDMCYSLQSREARFAEASSGSSESQT
jgi:hypothetical protein